MVQEQFWFDVRVQPELVKVGSNMETGIHTQTDRQQHLKFLDQIATSPLLKALCVDLVDNSLRATLWSNTMVAIKLSVCAPLKTSPEQLRLKVCMWCRN